MDEVYCGWCFNADYSSFGSILITLTHSEYDKKYSLNLSQDFKGSRLSQNYSWDESFDWREQLAIKLGAMVAERAALKTASWYWYPLPRLRD
jgi:hypothetical protein